MYLIITYAIFFYDVIKFITITFNNRCRNIIISPKSFKYPIQFFLIIPDKSIIANSR